MSCVLYVRDTVVTVGREGRAQGGGRGVLYSPETAARGGQYACIFFTVEVLYAKVTKRKRIESLSRLNS